MTPDEAFQAAITYGRLAASIGAAPEAVALATLLRGRAEEAALAGAISAAQSYLQEAAVRYLDADSMGSVVAAERLSAVLAHPLYREPTTAEVEQLRRIDALQSEGARGDRSALRAMATGSIMAVDRLGVRSIVDAEQFMRLAAADGTHLSAMGLAAVLYLRACWEAHSGSEEHAALAAAEAISIANAWALEGDLQARDRCASMVQNLSPALLALVSRLFPPALFYRDFEGVA